MRIIALLAVYNEERYMAATLEHLFRHGLHAYVIDNSSTDRTAAIAEQYRGRGLVGLETMPRDGQHALRVKLERKAQLAHELDGDWFMHMDADEFRLPPRTGPTLAEALAAVDAQGYNAVNFAEFVFIPTLEAPDHDHPRFQETMRWYYPFEPRTPARLNAWKRQPAPVDLTTHGGHQVDFPGIRPCPTLFRMRHYHFLSLPHAATKLVGRPYDPAELARGWHGWRTQIRTDMLGLPAQATLREYNGDDDTLDASNPRTQHYLGDLVQARLAAPPNPQPPSPAQAVPPSALARLSGRLRRMLRRA